MFDRAREQVHGSRAALDALRESESERSFLARFNDFVASAQLVLIALLKEGRGERVPGFDAWYSEVIQRMDEDDLMKIIREARDFDFGDGPHRLRFIADVDDLQVDELGRPVRLGSWWTFTNAPTLHVSMDNPPHAHYGEPLDRNDPVSLCEHVVAALDHLVDDASSAARDSA